jgi:anti-sigma factor RsiW
MGRLNSLMHGVLLRLFRLLTCREVVELSYDFLEGRLDPGLSRRLDRHLAACPRCGRFMKSYQRTKELGRVLKDGERQPLDPVFKREMLKFLLAERLR